MLLSFGRDTILEINLDNLKHNLLQFNRLLKGTKIMAVVKANAYGHGAFQISKAALDFGVSYLGVAFVDEGIYLRRRGILAPILILGDTPYHVLREAILNNLTITVYTKEQIDVLKTLVNTMRMVAKVHFKVDTGMGRIGASPSNSLNLIEELSKIENIKLEGIYTHLATADEEDDSYFLFQEEKFLKVLNSLDVEVPFIHIANSAATLKLYPAKRQFYNLVRLGIGMYGYNPLGKQKNIELKPILSFKSKISYLKKLEPGFKISYGGTYITKDYEWIATVPVGYADGIARVLSNNWYMLVRGVKVPIVGNICMDQLMLNVSCAMPLKIGDEVVIYGKQLDEEITLESVALKLKKIVYELLTSLSTRIPRVYFYKGKKVAEENVLKQL